MTFNCLLNSFFKDCEHKCIDAKLSNFVTTNITTLLSIDNVVYANEDELKKRWVSLFTNASSNADVTAVIDRNKVLWCEIWKIHAELELAKSNFAKKYLNMLPTPHECRRCP